MANLNKNARAEARGAAEDTAQKVERRKPGARAESQTPSNAPEQPAGDQPAATPTPEPVKPVALVVIAPNPKRAGTIAHRHFAMYGEVGKLTDVASVRAAGVRGKDITWDRDRRHILIGEEAEAYAALKTDEDRLAYLRDTLKIQEKTLIAWNYMKAPEPAPEPAAEAAAPAETASA